MQIPPLPPWDGLHPLIVHFPVALAVAAPVLLAFALVIPRRSRTFVFAAVILLAGAAAASFMSVSTGEAAAGFVEDVAPEVGDLLEQHGEAGELARTLLTVAAGAGLLLLVLPLFVRSLRSHGAWAGMVLLLLLGVLAVDVFVANASHLGGRLVHEHGILGRLGAPAEPADEGYDAPRNPDGLSRPGVLEDLDGYGEPGEYDDPGDEGDSWRPDRDGGFGRRQSEFEDPGRRRDEIPLDPPPVDPVY